MRPGRRRRRAAIALLLGLAAVASGRAAVAQLPDVPYVPTPPVVVDAMLKLAQVGPRDFVMDLGSGDGRIVIAAAKQYGARGLGVEIDGALVGDARRTARREGVSERVEFREDNLFSTDISRASVMTLYLYPRLLMQLRPRFVNELRPGTRIVSHEFDMEDWLPDAKVTVPVPDKPYGPPRSDVLLWIVPANAAGAWQWRHPAGGAAQGVDLTVTQRFQMLAGTALAGGRTARLEGGRVRGDEIRFILAAETEGRLRRHEYVGRISGDAIEGTVRVDAEPAAPWRATRTKRGAIQTQ